MSSYFVSNGTVWPAYTQTVGVTVAGVASDSDVRAVHNSLLKTNAVVNGLSDGHNKLESVVSTLKQTVLENPAMKMLTALGDEMIADKASVKNLTLEVETLTAQLTEAKLMLSRRESELTERLRSLQDELEEKNRAIDSVLLRANEFVSAVVATVPRAAVASSSSSSTPLPNPVADTPVVSNTMLDTTFVGSQHVGHVQEPASSIQ
jgi:hypothetical protein